MTAPTPEMIISGVPYRVLEVDGREPVALEDFAVAPGFLLEGGTGRHQVVGEGSLLDDGVRFHEKAGEGGKDVRVWRINADPEGFVAEVVV